MWRILLLLLLPVFSYAQPTGSLMIISEQGDPFYLYLNGQKMNETAVTKIRLDGLSGEYYTVKADFKSAAIQPITKRLYLMDDNYKMSDATYRIRKDKSGKARFVFFSMQTPNPQFKPEEGMKVIYFNRPETESAPEKNPENTPKDTKEEKQNTHAILTNVKGATVSLPNTNTPGAKPETEKKEPRATEPATKKEISQPVSQTKKNLPVDSAAVKAPAPQKAKADNKEVAVKKVETTKVVKESKAVAQTETEAKKETKAEPKKESKAEVYPSKKCNDWPMMKADFQKARQVVEEAKNDKQRLVKAREMATAHCLLVSQISDVSTLITDEKMKLDFVQYAYGFTIDKNNYQRLEKLFTAPEHMQAFKKFYQSRTQE